MRNKYKRQSPFCDAPQDLGSCPSFIVSSALVVPFPDNIRLVGDQWSYPEAALEQPPRNCAGFDMRETGAYSCDLLSGALVIRKSSVRSARQFVLSKLVPGVYQAARACPRSTNLTMIVPQTATYVRVWRFAKAGEGVARPLPSRSLIEAETPARHTGTIRAHLAKRDLQDPRSGP